MKANLLFLALILFQNIHAQNYVESGYYQLIYEADLADLEGDEDLAYAKYREAEKRCPLLNQPMYEEMQRYATLLMKNKEFDKALYYMDKLAVEYGHFPFWAYIAADTDSLLMKELLVVYPAFNDSIAPEIMKKTEDFYAPKYDALIEEITAMIEKDQQVRERFYNDEKDESYNREDELRKINQADTENAERLLEIINEYGLPTRKKWKINDISFDGSVSLIFVHNADNEELEQIAWEHVQSGEFSPSDYGFMLDKKQEINNTEEAHAVWLYWTYDNITDESRIIDVEHVDERRMAIGMPTREMEKRRKELIINKFNVNE